MLLRRLCRRCAFGLAVPLVFGWVHGLRLALARLSCRVQLRRLCRRCALGLAVPLGFGWVHGLRLARVRLFCRVPLRRLCRRCAFGLAVPLEFGLGAWPASRVGASARPGAAAAALAAGALWGWLCRLSLGWVHGLRLALARLSCRVQLPRFATGAFLVCFAAIPVGSIAYAGEALSVGIPWLH